MDYDTSALALGTRVDQYEIVQLLGRGAFAITYLVRDDELQKEYALKEYFPGDLVYRDGTSIRFADSSKSESHYKWGLSKFYDEARLLAQFAHPNIVSVRRVFEANATAYMLFDFLRGSTLEQWLQTIDSPPTQEEMDLIAGPLLDALELIHSKKVLHLDVSPQNIMIRSTDGAPVLLGFSTSLFEGKRRNEQAMLSFTSGYSPPEQYTTRLDRYGPWSDIYAAGATLYRAITASHPADATARQLSDDLRPVGEAAKGTYRPSFLEAVDAALRLLPSARPQSIEVWRPMLL